MRTSHFGPRLRELREAAGLTQKELGLRTGIGQSSIANWEQSLRSPTWEAVVLLADALGVDCRAFLQEPASTKPQGRGRPRKADGEEKPARRKGKK